MLPERPANRLRALLDTQEQPRPASRLRALVEVAWEPDPTDPARERRALPGGGFEYRPKGGTVPEPPQNGPAAAPPVDPALAAKRAELARIKAGGDITRGPATEPTTGELLKRYANMARGGMTEGADFLLNLPETAARAVTEPLRAAAVEAAPVFGSGVQGAIAQRFGMEDPAYRAEMARRVKEKRALEAAPPSPEGLSLYGAPEIVDETLQNAREERERLARETMDDQIAHGASPALAAAVTVYGPRFMGNLGDPSMLFGPAEARLAARAEKTAPLALEATIGRTAAESPGLAENVAGRLGDAAEHAPPAGGLPERPAVRLRALVEDAPTPHPKAVPDDFADLYQTAMDTEPPASGAVAPRAQLRVEHGPPLGGKPVLLARDVETGDTVGRLVYDRAPGGGFTVHMVETEGRGTGAARQLYKTAAATEGPYRGSVIRTGEGDALVARLRETDPDIFGSVRPDALPGGGGGAAEAGGLPHGIGESGDPGAGVAPRPAFVETRPREKAPPPPVPSEPVAVAGVSPHAGEIVDQIRPQEPPQGKGFAGLFGENAENNSSKYSRGGFEDSPATSLKNAVAIEERAARGLPEVERQAAMRSGSGWEEARQIYQEDPEAARALAKEVAAKPRALNPIENDLLLHDRMALTLQHREALAAEETALAAGDTPAITQARLRRTAIEEALNTNDEAAARAGTAWSASGRERQLLIREDYSPARLVQRARVAAGGAPPPPAVADRLVRLSRGIEEAAAVETAAEERSLARASGQAVESMRRDAAAVARKAGRAVSREALGAEFDALSREFGRKASTPRMGLDPDLVVLIGRMARNRVQAGVVELEEVVDHVYQAVRPHLETLTRRDVMEAISGYGKTSQPNADELAVRLREIRAQGRLVLALEDAEKGVRPLKTGYQRGPDSARVRALRQRVNEAMRANGVTEMMSPARQMRTGVDAARTRLERQIADLNRFIATGERPIPKTPARYPEELQQLVAERDRLKGVLSEMDGAGLTEEQRIRIAERVAERRVQDLQRRVTAGEIEPKPAPPPVTSPRLQALHAQQDSLAQQLRDLREAAGVPERGRLKAYKARLAKQEDEALARLEELRAGTAPARKAARSPVKLDAEALAARARVQALRQEADKVIQRLELARRPAGEKAMDWLVGWSRMMKLSGVGTLQKIGAAASERVFVFHPIEEVLGSALSKLPGVRSVAARAPVEGGGSVGAVAKSFAEFFSKETAVDALGHLRLAEGSLDLAHGKARPAGTAPEWMSFFGHVHAALKTPAKRAGFRYALEKQAGFYLARGANLLDPALQAEINARAYEYAQRQIFMGDNALVKAWRQGVGELRRRGHKGAAAALDIALPIVKVPANYVAEAADYAVGLPRGVAGLVRMLRAGVESIDPAEADQVLRQLKKGSFGAGLIALGAAGFEQVQGGGFYRKGEHRRKSDVQAGDLRLFGVTVPHLLAHHPAIEMLQVGAQMRRVIEQYHGRPGAVGEGVRSSVAGLASQVPFFEEPAEMGSSLNEKGGPTRYGGQLLRGATLPPDVQRYARLLDEKGQHDRADAWLKMLGLRHIEARKRKPDDLVEEEMMGIPGLRPKVR